MTTFDGSCQLYFLFYVLISLRLWKHHDYLWWKLPTLLSVLCVNFLEMVEASWPPLMAAANFTSCFMCLFHWDSGSIMTTFELPTLLSVLCVNFLAMVEASWPPLMAASILTFCFMCKFPWDSGSIMTTFDGSCQLYFLFYVQISLR